MSDSVMLVCAVLASLAAGVLVAYSVCLAIFAVFRMRTLEAAKQSPIVVTSSVVEG